jgi:hypothetical protein
MSGLSIARDRDAAVRSMAAAAVVLGCNGFVWREPPEVSLHTKNGRLTIGARVPHGLVVADRVGVAALCQVCFAFGEFSLGRCDLAWSTPAV